MGFWNLRPLIGLLVYAMIIYLIVRYLIEILHSL